MAKGRKITLMRYIASQSPDEAIEFLQNEGYRIPSIKTEEHLAALLGNYVQENGEAGLTKMVQQLHPDYEAILQLAQPAAANFNAAGPEKEAASSSGCGCANCKGKCGCKSGNASYMNAVGCSSCAGSSVPAMHFNAAGAAPQSSSDHSKLITAMLVTGTFLAVFGVFMNATKSK